MPPPVPAFLAPLIVFILLIPALVYLDATRHRIGKHHGDRGSISAGAWALWSLIPLVGVAFAVIYLVERKDLIRQAGEHPVTVPRDRQSVTVFLLIVANAAIHGLLITAPRDTPEDTAAPPRSSRIEDGK